MACVTEFNNKQTPMMTLHVLAAHSANFLSSFLKRCQPVSRYYSTKTSSSYFPGKHVLCFAAELLVVCSKNGSISVMTEIQMCLHL